jgi:hypothetical protein
MYFILLEAMGMLASLIAPSLSSYIVVVATRCYWNVEGHHASIAESAHRSARRGRMLRITRAW